MAVLITENDYKWEMITYGYLLLKDIYSLLITTITTYIRIRKKEYCLDFFPALPISKMPKNRSIFVFKAFLFF